MRDRGRRQRVTRSTPTISWAGELGQVFVDPARLQDRDLAFIESLVWWAREGPVRVEARAPRRDLRRGASRRGTDLTPDEAEALFVPRRPGEGAGSKIGLFVARGRGRGAGGRAWARGATTAVSRSTSRSPAGAP